MRNVFVAISILFFLSFIIPKEVNEGKPAVYYFSKAEESREKNDFKSAYKYYSKAISIDPNYTEAFWKRGLLKVDMDSGKSAINDFTKVIELKASGEAYYQRGCARWVLKDSTHACQDWGNACNYLYNHACDLVRERCR